MEAKLNINTITREKLEEITDAWAKTTFGLDFQFRPKQKESIIDIIWGWYRNHDRNIVLDAPTGSGKSVIAMAVGGILSSYFGKKGYILISDLSLLQQYANDLEIYLQDWGVIRGQQTYNCLVNGFNFQSGVCQLQGYHSYVDICAHYQDCAKYCEYILAREKAIAAPVTVCTYTHWLLQQNYVKPKMQDAAPFGERDFVICDEAHKLLDIVQNHFSPKFGKEDTTKINLVIDNMHIADKEALKSNIKNKREEIKREEDNSKLKDLLNDYYKLISRVASSAEDIKTSFGKQEKLTKNDRMVISACEFIKDHHCKFEDYVAIIFKIGEQYIIKNSSDNNDSIIFNCLHESYLMSKAFHSHVGKVLYMSATIGDPAAYSDDIAINDYKYIKLPVVFDYTNSPIYYVNEYKMSYNEKETSFPRIVEMISAILKMYPNLKGIIQTGSYSFANKLISMLNPQEQKRILLYNDSRDKQEKIDEYKYSTNKVLIGPSLVEGLSLNDDLCRFLIIMKVPYPSLADKYVARKSQFNPAWYNNTTSISLLQGVGRGVRNNKDWCVTFILDACFYPLYLKTQNMFPQEFTNRIQVIPSYSILKYNNI